jgi:hypothetical protein
VSGSRLRLDPASYEVLRQQVLRRDDWRCQSCGAMANLEVHHQEFRSHSGADSEENLITLCYACHGRVHGRNGWKQTSHRTQLPATDCPCHYSRGRIFTTGSRGSLQAAAMRQSYTNRTGCTLLALKIKPPRFAGDVVPGNTLSIAGTAVP